MRSPAEQSKLEVEQPQMNMQQLIETAMRLVADDKGLLAMDESNPTCNKRFAKLGIPQTEKARRAFREMIVTTPGLGECISGAILFDETIHAQKIDGTPFVKAITDAGIIPGIKVDVGAKDMAGHPGEKITEGLDGLRERRRFKDYGPHCWGITASEGPGPDNIEINGIDRQFFDYVGRGVPYGPDDGTLAPWALVASLPFAPEIVLPALHHCIHQTKMTKFNSYGFKASFNPTHPGAPGNPYGWWVSPWHYGLNQGPIILMIENYRTEMLWRLM